MLALLVIALFLASSQAKSIEPGQQGNRLLIDGVNTPLIFARNFSDARYLDFYQKMGFNCVFVRIDNPAKHSLDKAEEFITAAEAQGLYIIVELANGPWSHGQYADLADEDYRVNSSYYLETVINRLRNHPMLIGWVVSTVDERQFLHYFSSFGDYLAGQYGNEEQVSAAWSVLDEVDGKILEAPRRFTFAIINSYAATGQIDQYINLYASGRKTAAKIRADFKRFKELQQQRENGFRSALQTQYQTLDNLRAVWNCQGRWAIKDWSDIAIDNLALRENHEPGSSPRSLLDLANYRIQLSSTLFDWWAQEIRRYDSRGLLFAGSQNAYRSIMTIPASYQGILTELYPGLAEADLDTQNAHGIDMARRGNSKIVLAGIQVAAIPKQQLADVMSIAALHGAAGLCLTDWETLMLGDGSGGYQYAGVVRDILQNIIKYNLLARTPAPRLAIVYSPFLPGRKVYSRALYGYMPAEYLHISPVLPYFTFREGTSYGQIDYLAPADLATVPLDKYAAIILPTVFDLPPAAQDALLNYAEEIGGTVLADIGLGTIQATGDLYHLPEKMLRLFNVMNSPGIRRDYLNLEVYRQNPRFPGLLPGSRTIGEVKGYMITQLTDMIPLAGTDLLFRTIAKTGYTRPTPRPPQPLERKPTRGMFIHRKINSDGQAIFAPFPLYQYWLPGGDMLFNRFHRELYGEGYDIELLRPAEFLPALTQIARFEDGSVMSWSRQTQPVINLRNPPIAGKTTIYWIAAGKGDCLITPQQTIVRFDQPGFNLAQPLPCTLQRNANDQSQYYWRVARFDEMGVQLTMSSDTTIPHNLELTFSSSEAYPIAPLSRHKIFITTSETQQLVVSATAQGTIPLSLSGEPCRLTILPDDGTEIVVPVRHVPDDDVVVPVKELPNP